MNHKTRSVIVVSLMLVTPLLVACGAPLRTPTPIPPAVTRAPPTDTPIPPPVTPVPPTNTSMPPTTSAYPPTDTPTLESATVTPTPEPTPTPVPDLVDAVVTAPQLNMRTGPGTDFESVKTLVQDEPLEVTGQSGACAWLQVTTSGGASGWVARVGNGTEYTKFNIPCETVPEVEVPTPTLRPEPASPPPALARPVPQVILSADEVSSVLPTTMCITNAFEESETLSGFTCFVDVSAIGATDVTMMIYVLTAYPEGAPCPSRGSGNARAGEPIPLPQSAALPPDAALYRDQEGGFTLSATIDAYFLLVGLTAGDPTVVNVRLADVAVLQARKIRQDG